VAQAVYHPLLEGVLRFPKLAIGVAVILVAITVYPFSQLGSEFMPPINEGDLLYMPTTMPGISITEAKNILQQTDRIIRTFRRWKMSSAKAGRAETATDPAPLSMLETTIRLKDPKDWRSGVTMDGLIRQMERGGEISRALQLLGLSHQDPHRHAVHGHQTPIGLKITGPDLEC